MGKGTKLLGGLLCLAIGAGAGTYAGVKVAQNKESAIQAETNQISEDRGYEQGYLDAVSEKEESIATLESEIETLETQKTALEGQVTSLTDEKTTLEAQKTTLEGQVSALTQEKTTLQSQKTALEGQVAALTLELENAVTPEAYNAILEQLTTAQESLDAVAADYDAAAAALTTAQTQLAAQTEAYNAKVLELETAQTSLTAAQAQVTALQGQITELQGQVSDLQAQLENAGESEEVDLTQIQNCTFVPCGESSKHKFYLYAEDVSGLYVIDTSSSNMTRLLATGTNYTFIAQEDWEYDFVVVDNTDIYAIHKGRKSITIEQLDIDGGVGIVNGFIVSEDNKRVIVSFTMDDPLNSNPSFLMAFDTENGNSIRPFVSTSGVFCATNFKKSFVNNETGNIYIISDDGTDLAVFVLDSNSEFYDHFERLDITEGNEVVADRIYLIDENENYSVFTSASGLWMIDFSTNEIVKMSAYGGSWNLMSTREENGIEYHVFETAFCDNVGHVIIFNTSDGTFSAYTIDLLDELISHSWRDGEVVINFDENGNYEILDPTGQSPFDEQDLTGTYELVDSSVLVLTGGQSTIYMVFYYNSNVDVYVVDYNYWSEELEQEAAMTFVGEDPDIVAHGEGMEDDGEI